VILHSFRLPFLCIFTNLEVRERDCVASQGTLTTAYYQLTQVMKVRGNLSDSETLYCRMLPLCCVLNACFECRCANNVSNVQQRSHCDSVEGQPLVAAVTRERRYGPSRLGVNDDDDDDAVLTRARCAVYSAAEHSGRLSFCERSLSPVHISVSSNDNHRPVATGLNQLQLWTGTSGVVSGTTVRALVLGRFSHKKI